MIAQETGEPHQIFLTINVVGSMEDLTLDTA